MNKVLDKLTQLTKTMKQYAEKIVLHLLSIVNTLDSIDSELNEQMTSHSII